MACTAKRVPICTINISLRDCQRPPKRGLTRTLYYVNVTTVIAQLFLFILLKMLDIWHLTFENIKCLQYTYLITALLKNLRLIIRDNKTCQSKLTNNSLGQPNKLLVNFYHTKAKHQQTQPDNSRQPIHASIELASKALMAVNLRVYIKYMSK